MPPRLVAVIAARVPDLPLARQGPPPLLPSAPDPKPKPRAGGTIVRWTIGVLAGLAWTAAAGAAAAQTEFFGGGDSGWTLTSAAGGNAQEATTGNRGLVGTFTFRGRAMIGIGVVPDAGETWRGDDVVVFSALARWAVRNPAGPAAWGLDAGLRHDRSDTWGSLPMVAGPTQWRTRLTVTSARLFGRVPLGSGLLASAGVAGQYCFNRWSIEDEDGVLLYGADRTWTGLVVDASVLAAGSFHVALAWERSWRDGADPGRGLGDSAFFIRLGLVLGLDAAREVPHATP